MKKALALLLTLCLLLGAVSAAAADGAAPSYVPARDNSDLYQDMGLLISFGIALFSSFLEMADIRPSDTNDCFHGMSVL